MSALRSAGSSPSPTLALPCADLACTWRWPRLVPAARRTAGAVDVAPAPSRFSSTALGLVSVSGFFSASADATSVAMTSSSLQLLGLEQHVDADGSARAGLEVDVVLQSRGQTERGEDAVGVVLRLCLPFAGQALRHPDDRHHEHGLITV